MRRRYWKTSLRMIINYFWKNSRLFCFVRDVTISTGNIAPHVCSLQLIFAAMRHVGEQSATVNRCHAALRIFRVLCSTWTIHSYSLPLWMVKTIDDKRAYNQRIRELESANWRCAFIKRWRRLRVWSCFQYRPSPRAVYNVTLLCDCVACPRMPCVQRYFRSRGNFKLLDIGAWRRRKRSPFAFFAHFRIRGVTLFNRQRFNIPTRSVIEIFTPWTKFTRSLVRRF